MFAGLHDAFIQYTQLHVDINLATSACVAHIAYIDPLRGTHLQDTQLCNNMNTQ